MPMSKKVIEPLQFKTEEWLMNEHERLYSRYERLHDKLEHARTASVLAAYESRIEALENELDRRGVIFDFVDGDDFEQFLNNQPLPLPTLGTPANDNDKTV